MVPLGRFWKGTLTLVFREVFMPARCGLVERGFSGIYCVTQLQGPVPPSQRVLSRQCSSVAALGTRLCFPRTHLGTQMSDTPFAHLQHRC